MQNVPWGKRISRFGCTIELYNLQRDGSPGIREVNKVKWYFRQVNLSNFQQIYMIVRRSNGLIVNLDIRRRILGNNLYYQ